MKAVTLNSRVMHFRDDGPIGGPVLMFSNSLGTDLRIWDDLVALLPEFRCIRYDKRGHGLSECPAPPYYMGDLVADAGALLDHLGLREVVFVGLSIGGLIGQGLAAERPDLVKALVLADTAAKIGSPDLWHTRVEAIKESGLEGMGDDVMERWFSRGFLSGRKEELAVWRAMLTRTPEDGYIGCAMAIAETDLLESTSRLTLPAMAIVGRDDKATPPDLVRETADLIEGAEFHIISKAGHLPCVEQPQAVAELLRNFLTKKKLA